MAITDIQISEELQTGAPSIKYRGNEGPQSPQEEQMGAQDYSSPQYRMQLIEKLMDQGLDFGAASNEADRLIKLMLDRQRQGSAEGGRAEYGLGSLVKSITRPIKKFAKSDLGKAALTAAAMYKLGGGNFFGPNRAAGFSFKNIIPGFKKFMVGAPGGVSMGGNRGVGQGIMTKGTKGILGAAGKLSPWKAMTAASLIPFTGMGMGKQESLGNIAGMDDLKFDFNYDDMIAEVKAAVGSGDVEEIKRVNLKYGLDLVEDTDVYAAEGGIMRAGYYAGGQSIPSEYTMEDARKTAMQDRLGGITEVMKQADLYRQGDVGQMYMAEGGLMNLGGMEKDYRNTGGFVDIGAKEKADDVPARLSVNEFVMTADAVRGAGDGDIDKGAKRMEDLMEKLESKGKKENMKMAGGGERGWKAQMRAMEIAEEEYGKDFYDLNDALQHKIYNRALQEIDDMFFDMSRKGASDMFEVSERLSAVV